MVVIFSCRMFSFQLANQATVQWPFGTQRMGNHGMDQDIIPSTAIGYFWILFQALLQQLQMCHREALGMQPQSSPFSFL